ncbi:hypothetical protein J1N35_022925 [Gossypium stocksii]|uniref:Uncharacterized protein n=1 Tax=Gossypium stocksii TaxID=47602 RepID=A0A9D3VJC1_9ROSI|nr:hypothetical protein J1N35_022925 [Gossypium stocksii]
MFRLIMPRKRTRASTQINKSQNKFHCEETKARYESIFKNQLMHLEKGFTLKESNYIDFMARIRQVAEAINWELFCEKRLSVDMELVCEFYSNLISSELTEVFVRGIKVPITLNAINEFSELPNFENDEYSSLMSNIESKKMQEILEELTIPESEDLEEGEDSIEIEPMQSVEILDKAEPIEPQAEAEPDVATLMFRTQSSYPDL